MNRLTCSIIAILLAGVLNCHAQWGTQTINLKSGWNAVYLHVDATHVTLDELVGGEVANPIQEIWQWAPTPGTSQFVVSPASPSQGTQWASWVRSSPVGATLTRLAPNAAYLIRSSAVYSWGLKGKPTVPYYKWTSSGQNFIGFPTIPGAGAPTFDSLLEPAPELRVGASIFKYVGGAITDNPVQIFDFTADKAERGQAYWVKLDAPNHYFGPFELVFNGPSGIRFGSAGGQSSFRLRNNANKPVTVTLTGVPSESAPSGQTPVFGDVPVLVRGPLNTSTLTFAHTPLASGPQSWTLARSGEAGSEVEIVLGVDRSAMSGPAGRLYGSLLRFRDSLNLTQIDVGVSAEVESRSGLWVGAAEVSSVSHYLKPYAKATTASELQVVLDRLGLAEGVNGFHYELEPTTGKILVFGGPTQKTGSYLLDGAIKVDPGTVARPFPLRLILHHDGATSRLLQKVFVGLGQSSQPVVATKESLLLQSKLASARRISSVHLPTSEGNIPWNFTGTLSPGSSLTATVDVNYDDQSSNPFLHTYHPDHDNLDAKFAAVLPRGQESYGIRRQITLSFTLPNNDFDSLTRSGSVLSGNYVEVVSFLGAGSSPARQYDVKGSFVFNRITDISTLTQ